MKKAIAIVCSIIAVLIACVGCFMYFRNSNSVSDWEIVKLSELYINEEGDLPDISTSSVSQSEAENDKQYDIDKKIEEVSEIRIIDYKEDEGTAVCDIKAPDIYSFVVGNIDVIDEQSDEETYDYLCSYLDNGDYKIRRSKITVDAIVDNNILIIDDTSYEFQDAIHGGINSLMTDFLINGLNDMSKEN